jgi:hypothetical protein
MKPLVLMIALCWWVASLSAQLPGARPVPRTQILPLPDFQASFQFEGRELTRFHPTAFHVRDDGWMCSCLSLEKPVEVNDTVPLRVRWALWVHQGVPDQARCEAMWRRFAELPLADMNKKP